MGVPLLMRVWAEFFKNDYVGAVQPDVYFESKFIYVSSFFDGKILSFLFLDFYCFFLKCEIAISLMSCDDDDGEGMV